PSPARAFSNVRFGGRAAQVLLGERCASGLADDVRLPASRGCCGAPPPVLVVAGNMSEEIGTDSDRTRAEAAPRAEAPRRSESRYSGILQAAADAIVSVDENQRITFFNRAAEQAFGYSQAEVIGEPLGMLVPERFRAAHREHVARFAAGPEASRLISDRTAQLFGR